MLSSSATQLLRPVLLAGLTTGSAVQAQPAPAAPTPVVAIVRVPKPWYAPQALVTRRMRDTQAQYAALPGLLFKAYSFERDSGDFGGVYHWQDAASAAAWFNADWHARVLKERGVAGDVRFFDAPVSVDNVPGGTADDARSSAVVTLVEIPQPDGVSVAQLDAAFRDAVPTYQRIPGLLRKHFTRGNAGGQPRFGGVYLWKDEAAARAWFTPAWHAQVRERYGVEARIEWFDTPVLLRTRQAANVAPASTMIVAAP